MPPDPAADAAVRALERDADRFYGKYRGVVTSNTDPLNRGRIQATVPSVLGDTPSGWALPCAPYAGATSGLFTVPPVGAGVWIEFEGGEPSHPIWSGTWWAAGELPRDEAGAEVRPTTKILRSDTGLMVSLDDSGQTITISDASGTNLVTIQVGSGTVRVQGTARVVLEAPRIDHGASASHPAVFGDRLMTYLNQLVTMFNSHMHVGQTAAGMLPVVPTPPVPPFPPPTPDLVSLKNSLE